MENPRGAELSIGCYRQVQTPIFTETSLELRILIAAGCQGFWILGYDQGVMSGLIGADNQFAEEFNHQDAKLQGIISSIYDFGCVAGALFNFFFGE